MDKMTSIREVMAKDATVHSLMRQGLENCVIELANHKARLEGRVMELEMIAPKRIIVNGREYIWRCPENLIPVSLKTS